MSDFPRWKYALVAVILLFGIVYALPNTFVPAPSVEVLASHGAVLDDSTKDKIATALTQQHMSYGQLQLDGDRLRVNFANADAQAKAADVIHNALGENYTVALNLASTVPAWLRSLHAGAMPLGLDLQGGVHFLLEVDKNAVVSGLESRYADDIRGSLHDHHINFDSVSQVGGPGQGINIVLRNTADRDAARNQIQLDNPSLDVTDQTAAGGAPALLAKIKPAELAARDQAAITQNVATLRNRINQLGVSEPVIQQQGDDQIVVELAGVQDPAQAKRILGEVATLEYRAGYGSPQQAIEAERSGNVPPDARLYHGTHGEPYLLSKRVIATGNQLIDASSGFDQQTGTPMVSVTLNSSGANNMLAFTSASVGKPMGVVYIERTTDIKMVDGKEVRTPHTTEQVISYANIAGVFGKNFQTSGLASPQAASELALLLKGGSLAAPVDIVQQQVVGPSLGQDNIHKGLMAVLLGLGLVLVAAAIYYKLFGIVADIALFFNLVLLVAVMSMIGVTLTMPGIAGIVLTLGMAIDANVLICERIREELRNGSTPLASIRAGYDKAWGTILDANVTHLIAALALTTMGSGPIRGFGITLLIGILTSMFTSVTLTHAITALIHHGRKLKTLSV
ncbi:protein translocase subunit SecD [Frateuria aurantia]|uniref:Protein translocase subunit SecD n=1 Tax=Frateuria aurantia (strain ATCC 33424 / DSM 6220 / KCTC 2777 / LMG 1558 / NBRC 3245 / NCIMB 13370) TaxID=767434 RepID=H8L1P5_FRAAD|nr:protein translocase subunit SecD [Frateuria aurantia]AFC85405.1 protein-export membrane protein, SecD/SecF family [Frateuria aurantia DSM 6220]